MKSICRTELPSRQFSLRLLLAATATAACWFSIFRSYPHVAMLLSGIALASITTILFVGSPLKCYSQFWRLMLAMPLMASWFYLYILSIGPAIAIEILIFGSHNQRLQFLYAPVIWLHYNTPLAKPLEEYTTWWMFFGSMRIPSSWFFAT